MKNIVLTLIVCVLMLVSCNGSTPNISNQTTVTPSDSYITGSVKMPSGVPYSLNDVSVKVVEGIQTIKIVQVDTEGKFNISGLSPDKTYDLYFSTAVQNTANRSIAESQTKGLGSFMSSIKPGQGMDIGIVPMKPLGTITGSVKLKDKGDGEHYGIDVYIPGSSYIAKTDDNGNFKIYNVPQGNYQLRYEKTGFKSIKLESISLISVSDTENPVTVLDQVILSSASGTVKGNITIKSSSTDNSGISITLTNLNSSSTNSGYTSTTDIAGNFIISDVAEGRYKAIYSFPNLTSIVSKEFEVTAGSVIVLPYISFEKETEVSGEISGKLLHWTKAGSPYRVTGNIRINSNDQLIIDPGVEVRIDGPYSIISESRELDGIKAIGTESEPIWIHGIEEGKDSWKGISGGTFDYVRIEDAAIALLGNTISNSYISAKEKSLGSIANYQYFSQIKIENCTINGDIEIPDCQNIQNIIIKNNIINGSLDFSSIRGATAELTGNKIYGGVYLASSSNAYDPGMNIKDNLFYLNNINDEVYIEIYDRSMSKILSNNYFNGYSKVEIKYVGVYDYNHNWNLNNNEFENINELNFGSSINSTNNILIDKCIFKNINNLTSTLSGKVSNSNFYNITNKNINALTSDNNYPYDINTENEGAGCSFINN